MSSPAGLVRVFVYPGKVVIEALMRWLPPLQQPEVSKYTVSSFQGVCAWKARSWLLAWNQNAEDCEIALSWIHNETLSVSFAVAAFKAARNAGSLMYSEDPPPEPRSMAESLAWPVCPPPPAV